MQDMRRALFVNGFMATGKSSVARVVSERSGHPLVDLDALVEARAAMSIPELFRTRGEQAFRQLEREALLELLETTATEKPPVVALGGGALLSREPRLRVLDEAVVVTLEASPERLLERGVTDGRPMLASGDPRQRIAELLETRRAAYAEAHARIRTDGLSVEAVAERVLNVWARDPIAVAADDRSYAVDVGIGIATARLAECVSDASLVLLVSDSNVFPLHGARIMESLAKASSRVAPIVLDAGEEHKTVAAPARIWERALEVGADRKSMFLALGGGVVSDITGFAAAAWMRGVRWIGIPTTLLAMVDASVGGKTGVDLGAAKNAVGAFWQPSAVQCDAELSATEPARGYRSALAEVVKTALIGDPELFELMERELPRVRDRDPDLVAEMARRSVRVKARIVSQDEREGGLRATLNLGHTLGHAFEAQANYTGLTHGEAVSLGLVAALRIGKKLSLTPQDLAARTERLLASLELPYEPTTQPIEPALALLGHDKKRAGARLKFVVAKNLGRVETVDLPLTELQALARELT